MIIGPFETQSLTVPRWELNAGECWAVIGRNGSGKRDLADAILEHNKAAGNPCEIALLSFEQQQAFYEAELREDDSDFIDRFDAGTTVREMLGIDGPPPGELAFLGLDPILDRGYRLLSTGESRKALLARALLQKPDLLILDEPYDSLDRNSRRELEAFFQHLAQTGRPRLLFLLTSLEDVSLWHSHLAILEKGELIARDTREAIAGDPAVAALLDFDPASLPPWPDPLAPEPVPDPVIDLKDGRVAYGETAIFKGIDLHIRPGEHTLLTGPNGSGKSTLLALITGDHPQCYGNALTVLGFRRGSGESIWDVKRRIGIVSPELHRAHRVPGSVLDITASGFFDSIGLYRQPAPEQIAHATHWLDLCGMHARKRESFRSLSWGEQRLVLIARALVKQPVLLVCDEPTQGLDAVNRRRFLYFLEYLAGQRATTIVMASHRRDEDLPLFHHRLELAPSLV